MKFYTLIKRKPSLKIVTIFFIFSIITLFPFLIDQNIFRQNDLGYVFANLYIKQEILNGDGFPLWNFYANQGIPVLGDPLFNFFNPLVMLPVIILPVSLAIKTTYLLISFLSTASMYYCCRKIGIKPLFSALLGLTYITGGFLASRIVAAHGNFLLSYPIFPLILVSTIMLATKPSKFFLMINVLSFTLIFFSGDLYTLFYSFVLYTLTMFYILITKPNKLPLFIFSFVLFLGLSAIKILPVVEASPYLYKVKEPLVGSVNLTSFIYYMFFPVKSFFRLIGISNQIITSYAWWEKIAFIGPLPFLALLIYLFKRKVIKLPHGFTLFGSLFCFILIATPSLPINPFNLVVNKIEILQTFHVPSRALFPIGVILLVLTGLILQDLEKILPKKYSKLPIILLISNLILTLLLFEYILIKKVQPVIDTTPSRLLKVLHEKDKSIYYVSERLSLGNVFLVGNIKIPQKSIQNYPFLIKDSPAIKHVPYDFENKDYQDIIPKYAVLPKDIPLKAFKGRSILSSEKYVIYKLENYTPYASLGKFPNKNIDNVRLSVNKITLKAYSLNSDTLTIVESYMPGWRVYIDGKENKLIENRFLKVQTEKGNHLYEFVFRPLSVYIGGIITFITFLVSTLYLFISHRFSKNRKHLI